ncbi:uncharacterized protein [Chironomus tepperi]|uniref:uncharacterized protein isoform X2 n=1 Tax=Chironomus tepperi TaxID=113505 RepID=UPI00391F767D
MISHFKVSTTKRFYCWIILHLCILTECLESSSNTLTSHPLKEPLRTIENGVHTLDDTKHEHPLRHHFSINRAKNDGDNEHHNLVVSYENSIVNEYNFDSNNNINTNNNNNINNNNDDNDMNIINNYEAINKDNFNQIMLNTNDDEINDDVDDSSSSSSSSSDKTPNYLISKKSNGTRSKRFAEFNKNVDEFVVDEPYALPLRPIVRGPFEADDQNLDEVSVIYVEPHSKIKLNCEVDLDVQSSVWLKDGQVVQAVDSERSMGSRFIKEPRGGLTINNVMLEDDGYWQCEAENFRGYMETGRSTKLVVLTPPRPPYLLFETRRLDASNLFIPVKENAEIALSCVSEGGNPKPLLTWEILLNPSVDHHALKLPPDSLEVQVVKPKEKEKEKDYKINSGAKSDAKLPIIYRAHHNARVLCVMEHPSLKIRQNASIVLDVQYTPSFAITRTPGFGYPLREGIPVSLKCDVDSNPPSTAMWQKDDGDPPIPQSGDGLLNFTAIRREHSGWYKCTARHLNKPYSSFGYFLNVRYDALDVTSEPDEANLAIASSSSLTQSKMPIQSHNPQSKFAQLEVELGGSVTLQCPQGSLGCWSHLDPVTQRLRGVGVGTFTATGQYSLKDIVYQDAGIYKCVGQSSSNKKKLEVLNSVIVGVKGFPTVTARNKTPSAYPGLPLHLNVEFCANPPATAARWLHGDRIYTPGNQYGADVLAYGVTDLPTPFCKEARLTIVHMHEKVPRTFYFIVSTPAGVAEDIIEVNFTTKHHTKRINSNINMNNNLPIFSSSACSLNVWSQIIALSASAVVVVVYRWML